MEPISREPEARDVGKRVHGRLYVHRHSLPELTPVLQRAVAQAGALAGNVGESYNVIKIDDEVVPTRISLLTYEDFQQSAFPALLEYATVDLSRQVVRRGNLRASRNPPILHRKELLLSPDHPHRDGFSKLTTTLERMGLFKDSLGIGLKQEWEKRLREFGVRVVDHRVVDYAREAMRKTNGAKPIIARHRTAISRNSLSAPIQALQRHGLLSPERTLLDYGCGYGDDVQALAAAGIVANGWDPYFRPDTPREPSDIVNLGFVLNVIEDPKERLETLRQAYSFARTCLSVAVIIDGREDAFLLEPYNDGFLTRRQTFQKYYLQGELKEFLEQALQTEAIAVAPGVFLVFQDKVAEQHYLAARYRRRPALQLVAIGPRRPRERPSAAERLRPVLEPLWQRMLELGRSPDETELEPVLQQEILSRLGTLRRAERACRRLFGDADLAASAAERRGDLLVYFALNLFNRRQAYRQLPKDLQRDIKAFFGTNAAGHAAGRQLLFSIGDPRVIADACSEAASRGLGFLRTGDSLHLHSTLVERLPAVLRCYVGCAEKLFGDITGADIVKIHIRSGKLTLLSYNNFDKSPLPTLRERVRIDMRAQRIDFFDYTHSASPQLLVMKSHLMAADQPGYERQRLFDEKLSKFKILNLDSFAPTLDEFQTMLAAAHLRVVGFDVRRKRIVK